MKRFFIFLMLLVFLPACGDKKTADKLVVRLAKEPVSRPVAPVACWNETQASPRPLRFHFLRIDLQDPRIEPCVIIADDPDGAGPAEACLTSPLELAGRVHGLLAAVNANVFNHLASTKPEERRRGWFTGKPVDIEGLAAADGVIRSPPQNNRASLWFDAGNQPHLGAPTANDQIRQGVADWLERLVANGEIVAKDTPDLHPRTLAGFDKTRRWMFLAVVDGRQPKVSEGMTLREAAELMKSRGCFDAVNLDGGGSSIMLLRNAKKAGFAVINHPSDGVPRPIPVMLGIKEKK